MAFKLGALKLPFFGGSGPEGEAKAKAAGGLPLIVATLGFTFLGETLRDQFDPRLRKDA